MATAKMTSAQRREFQKEMSALKKAGLLPASFDVRKAQPTKHYRGLARKFEGVITGRDVVVKVPRGQGSSYGEKFNRRGDAVVVPKPMLNGKARYNKRTGEIISTAKVRGGRVEAVYHRTGEVDFKAAEGEGVSFVIYLARHDHYEGIRADSVAGLEKIFPDSLGNFADWVKYIQIEKFSDNPDDDEYGDGDVDYVPRVPPKRAKAKRKSKNAKGRNA